MGCSFLKRIPRLCVCFLIEERTNRMLKNASRFRVLGWGPGPVSPTSGSVFVLNPQPGTTKGFSAACWVGTGLLKK